ncbi:MAG: methyl-accepting chemotaxis protein [Acetobacteraceae bacterium]
MLRSLMRISDWPFLVKLAAGPALALAALGLLAWLGISRIGEQSLTAETLIRDHEATARLNNAAKGILTINGRMYRVLALQAAQTADLDAADELKKLETMVDDVNATLREYRDRDATAAQKPEVDGLIADVEKYKGAIAWVTQMLDVDFGSAVSFLKPFEGTFAEMNNRLTGMEDALSVAARSDAQAASISAASTRETFQWATAAAFALVVLIALAIGPATVRSIRRIASVTLALANGETGVDTAALHRRDELGAIVESLGVFRDGLLRVRTLQTEQEQEREQAENAKRNALLGMAKTIEDETRSAIDKVSERSVAMAELADGMRASAARTGTSAQSAATAASQAQVNVQTVASAAEELSTSIREIGAQVEQSTRIVGLAVKAGSETRATIEALNERVMRIGAVVDMISEIAGKTNLLALNATIEAARAGDAGKGFAVVASEVKDLATQTARSTQEITRHITEVRTATGASVEAVGRIERTINEINVIAGSIAAAVDHQGSATAEIARSVTETAAAANEMTSRIAEVSAEAEQTGTQAAMVHESTSVLANTMIELKNAVIRAVRTSSQEVNRRASERIAVDLACRITLAGGATRAGQVTDISDGGASVTAAVPMRGGDRGTLEIPGINVPLSFAVRSTDSRASHLAFDLDERTRAALAPFMDRLKQQRMAA